MLGLLGSELGGAPLDHAWVAAQLSRRQSLAPQVAGHAEVQSGPVGRRGPLEIGQVPLEDAEGMRKAETIDVRPGSDWQRAA